MKRLALLVVVALMAAPAMADVVTDPNLPTVVIEVVLDGMGGYELAFDATGTVPGYPGAPNGGISGFNLIVPSHLGTTVNTPKAVDPANQYKSMGFTVYGEDTWAAGTALFDGQNPVDSASLMYNVGIEAIPLDGLIPVRNMGCPARPVMAIGQGEPNYLDLQQYASGVNVFAAVGNAQALEAQVVWVPEPATMAMLALGGLAILRRRR